MARKGKLQIYTEYAVAKGIFTALSLLPRQWAVGLGVAVGRLGFRLLGGLRRVAIRNLELAYPEMSPEERLRTARGTFESLGRVLGEASQLRKITPENIRDIVDFDLGPEIDALYERVKKERRGILITTGHMGNWELLVQGFAILYEPISFLARPVDNPLIEDMANSLRTRFGARPINKSNSAMTGISILREGGFLGALVDVNAHPKEGVFVPFFGIPACTTSGAALMAIRSGALIFPCFCVYDAEAGKYKFVHGDPIEPTITGDRKADVLATTEAFTREIEAIIRRYPDQWLWIHKRWKTRPKGEPDLYRN